MFINQVVMGFTLINQILKCFLYVFVLYRVHQKYVLEILTAFIFVTLSYSD